MSNIFWPRRPDLCSKDGRDCRQVEEHAFRFKDAEGNEIGRLRVCGDFVLVMHGIDVEEVPA